MAAMNKNRSENKGRSNAQLMDFSSQNNGRRAVPKAQVVAMIQSLNPALSLIFRDGCTSLKEPKGII